MKVTAKVGLNRNSSNKILHEQLCYAWWKEARTLRHSKTMIIGHRGAPSLVPFSNTLESFEKAIELKVDGVECDVRMTKDQQIVCFHDETIEGVKLSEITFQELNVLASKQGFNVPLLEEVVVCCKGKVMIDVELKEQGYERAVADILQKYLTYDEFVIKSFEDDSVLAIKTFNSKIQAGLIVGKPITVQQIDLLFSELFPEIRLQRIQADFISPHYLLLRLKFLARMQRLGMKVFVWTVNEQKVMKTLFEAGVDGIITDHPYRAVQLKRSLS